MKLMTENFTESKFDAKNVNVVKSNNQQIGAFKSNRIFRIIKPGMNSKHSKTDMITRKPSNTK